VRDQVSPLVGPASAREVVSRGRLEICFEACGELMVSDGPEVVTESKCRYEGALSAFGSLFLCLTSEDDPSEGFP
jgi:hypothetical protein